MPWRHRVHDNSNRECQSPQETANKVFLVVYCLECAVKLFGLGLIGYFSDLLNILDITIGHSSVCVTSSRQMLAHHHSFISITSPPTP